MFLKINKLQIFCILVLLAMVMFQTVASAEIKLNLFSDVKTIKPGYPFWLGIQVDIPKGEHIYWINPGKNGLASEVIWQVPKSISVDQTLWPFPNLFYNQNVVTYGYANKIFLLTKVNPSEFLFLNEKVTIPVIFKYLECKKSCEPKMVTSSITLTVANESILNAENQKIFGKAYQAIPKKNSSWEIFAVRKKSYHLKLQIKIDNSIKKKMYNLRFFPSDKNLVKIKAHYQVRSKRNLFIFDLPLIRDYFYSKERLKGVLVYNIVQSGVNKEEAIIIDIPITQKTLIISKTMNISHLLYLIIVALIGGLILNLMPCVFPVISLKVLQLTELKSSTNEFFRLNFKISLKIFLFVLGILFTLWTLVGLLFMFRSTGEQLGWGFQLQEPLFVVFLIYLFFLISLNLFGIYKNTLFFSRFSGKFSFNTYLGSFLNGIMLVLVATPCTGPFLGAAVGLALMQNTVTSWFIFSALGLGLSLPYIIFALFPVLLNLLPKPGNWLNWFKELLAFPMILTALWLAYILYKETSIKVLFSLMVVLIFILFFIWLTNKSSNKLFKLFVILAVIFTFLYMNGRIKEYRSVQKELPIIYNQEVMRQEYSKSRLKNYLKVKKPVLVKVTADWCLICKMNDKLIFNTSKFAELANKKKLVVLIADWTKNNPDITDFLHEFNRNSVPFYIYFPVNKAPIILPEIVSFKTLDRLR